MHIPASVKCENFGDKKDKTPIEKQFEINELLKIYENIGYETEFIGNDDDRKKNCRSLVSWTYSTLVVNQVSVSPLS